MESKKSPKLADLAVRQGSNMVKGGLTISPLEMDQDYRAARPLMMTLIGDFGS